MLDGFEPDPQACALVDIGVSADGTIAFVSAPGAAEPPNWPRLDLAGRQVWPGLLELHAHIDKAGTAERASSPDGTLEGARQAAKRDREVPWSWDDAWSRMDGALQAAFSHGTVALRSHLDSQDGRTEPSWSVWPELRRAWAGRIAPGSPADLILFETPSALGVLATPGQARLVIRSGRPIDAKT